MKNAFLLATLLLTACAGKTIPLAIENNTALGCVDVLQVSPASTPVAILGGTRACVAEGAYDKAAALSLLANTYGAYDAKRVADVSSHQAVRVAHMGLMSKLTPEQRQAYGDALQRLTAEGSPERTVFCAEMSRMKEPRYYPKYMINHGMKAYNRAMGNAQTASAELLNYDPDTTWADVRKTYLKCQ